MRQTKNRIKQRQKKTLARENRYKRMTKYHRCKKDRSIGRRFRNVTAYDITDAGFRLAFYGIDIYVSREVFAWFLGATDKEIKTVWVTRDKSVDNPDDINEHGRYCLYWSLLDVDLGSNDLLYPELRYVEISANAIREQYYQTREFRKDNADK